MQHVKEKRKTNITIHSSLEIKTQMKINLFPIPPKKRSSHIPAQALTGDWYLVPKNLITDNTYSLSYICWKYVSPDSLPIKGAVELEKKFFGF